MKISLAWLNALLNRPVSAEEAEHALTFVGFPIESATPLPAGDTLLDVEVTSNRGDCLSHLGVAREVAAATGRRLQPPHAHTAIDPADAGKTTLTDYLSLDNRVAGELGVGGCPLFTLRLISGVRVGPSPQWMVDRLAAIGQRSINNVVDCTNYVLFELGSPSHVFDMARLRPEGGWAGNSGLGGKPAVIVRAALAGEKLTLLDGKTVELKPGELVVADGERAASLAGIMGGAESAVTEHTTDVLLEVATWSPGPIRAAARRLGLRTDSSFRFERRVDPRTVEAASRRVAELIVQTAGGALAKGVLHAGAPLPLAVPIAFRPDRARAVLGSPFSDDEMRAALAAQAVEIAPAPVGAPWQCTAPVHRPDIRIEEDLVEEVARTIGLDKIPIHPRVAVRVAPPQTAELAAREAARVLTGLGYFETVTFSFVAGKQARPFLPPGFSTLAVSDDRRGEEGTLRTALIHSLLACRRTNHEARSAPPGSVRLYEIASVYGESGPGKHLENRNLGLLADAPESGEAFGGGSGAGHAHSRRQAALRLIRGTIEQLVRALRGSTSGLSIQPGPSPFAALDAASAATITLDAMPLGVMGLVAAPVLAQFGLEHPVVVAEIGFPTLVAGYPPRATVHALPTFPMVERDLSLVLDQTVPWGRVESTIAAAKPQWMEDLRFVGTYRGKPLQEGQKSVTLRMTFRDRDRTLRDEEVNVEMARLIAHTQATLGAVVRT